MPKVATSLDYGRRARFGDLVEGTVVVDARGCRGRIREDCRAVINDDGVAWTYSPGDHMCTDTHVPLYPLDAPHPGTWSFHS